MSGIIVRRIGGLLPGQERLVLPGGALLLGPGEGSVEVRALDHGVVLVEPIRGPVLLAGVALTERGVADLAGGPVRLVYADGEVCELLLQDGGPVRESPPAPAAVAPVPDPLPAPATPFAPLVLAGVGDLFALGEPPPPPPPPGDAQRTVRRRIARKDRSSHRREGTQRRRRRQAPGSLAVSLGIHATLAMVLALLLSRVHWEVPRPPVTVAIRFPEVPPPDPDEPEAAAGAVEPEPVKGEPLPPEPEPAMELPGADRPGDAPDGDPGIDLDSIVEQRAVGAAGSDAGSFFQGRIAGRQARVEAGGGDSATEGALRRALEWLARHQGTDGTWDAREFGARCGGACPGKARGAYPEAATALALLPFLGAGHTHTQGPWRGTVARGLKALILLQNEDGSFGRSGNQGYPTGLATLTLAEAYGLTGSSVVKDRLERAVAYLAGTQSKAGGWRYAPGDGSADSSVTGWVAMALGAADKAGVAVPETTRIGARRWFRSMTTREGTVGYVSRTTGTTALLGVGYVAPLMLGEDPAAPQMRAVAGRLITALPQWDPDPLRGGAVHGPHDPLHWYYGSLAAHQHGDDTWLHWEARLRPILLDAQIREGHGTGSWDPRGGTGERGGRLVMTALAALCLEVYYRYPRVVTLR